MSEKVSLVTGGAGFIGSHMVDLLLEKGHRVRVIDNMSGGRPINLSQHSNNQNLQIENADILSIDPNHTIFKDLDYCFHFAGIGDIVPSIEHPLDYMNVNVQGTCRVLEGCRNSNLSRFLYAASSTCYGLAKTPTLETDTISPKYPYALSKYFGEQSVFHWSRVYKFPVNSIRIFNAYGPRSRTTGAYGAVFGVFLKQKLEGKPLTVVGDGEQKRDFVYVTDVANAFYIVSQEGNPGHVYNVGSGQPNTVNDLVRLLKSKAIYIPKRPGEPKSTWADISKITFDTNWAPKVSFEKGVEFILENIEYWKDAPLWDEESIAENTKAWFKYLS